MLTEYMFDIARIAEGAIAGDTGKVIAYCGQLEEHLQKNGEDEAAALIREIVSDEARTMQLAHTSVASESIPLDDDSSLPIADSEVFKDVAEVSLPVHLRGQIDEFITFYRSSDRLRAGGVSVSPSMLMFGPPGCGKTQLARHVASSLNLPLITARTDALISSYLGNTAKNIRMLFEYASKHPCALLDEFDAVAKMRDDQHELGELKRVVISLLQNIDSLGGDHILLAATNHQHLLDPAIWRRFAYKVELSLPDRDCREEMLVRFLRGRSDKSLLNALASITDGLTGSELRDIAESSIRRAIVSNCENVDRHNIASHVIGLLTDGDAPARQMDIPEQIRFLYGTGDRVTQKDLAGLFGKSQPYISKQVTKGGNNAHN